MKKCKDCIHDCVCNQMWRIADGCSYYEESRPQGVTSGTIVPIEWYEIKSRPLTDEERAAVVDDEFEFDIDEDCDNCLDCHLPDDDETVLISIYNQIMIDVFHRDGCCCWFEDYDIGDVKAWAHLPKPFGKT